MKTYLAFCDEFPIEFEAESRKQAERLAKFYGWKLHDLPSDDAVADAIVERFIDNPTIH